MAPHTGTRALVHSTPNDWHIMAAHALPRPLDCLTPATQLASAKATLTRTSPYSPEHPAAMRLVRACQGELDAYRALPVSR